MNAPLLHSPLLPAYVHVDVDDLLRAVYTLWRHGGLAGVCARVALYAATALTVAAVTYVAVECVDYGALLHDGELTDAFHMRLPGTAFGWFFLAVCVCTLAALAWYAAMCLRWLVGAHRVLRSFFGDEWDVSAHAWGQVTRWLAVKLAEQDDAITEESLRHRLEREDTYMAALVRAGYFTGTVCGVEVPYVTHVLHYALTPLLLAHTPGGSPVASTIPQAVVAHHAAQLRQRAIALIVVSAVAAPCLVLLVLVYYVIRYGQFLRLSPSFLASRHWSVYAAWSTRQPHEPRHEGAARLAALTPAMEAYAAVEPRGLCTTALQAASFYSSLLCVALVAVMVARDDFTDVTLLGYSLLWWVAVTTAVYAGARALEGAPKPSACTVGQVAEGLGVSEAYITSHWAWLYELRAVGFAKEVATILTLPAVVYFGVYRRAAALTGFVLTHTRWAPGSGNIFAP